MKINKNYCVILGLLTFIVGCADRTDKESIDPFKGMDSNAKKRELENALKRSAQKEHLQIDSYLERHNIVAQKTGTGVRCAEYMKGEGVAVKAGDLVEASYEVTNIKGDTLYSIGEENPVSFRVEKSEKESGLHEAIKLLKVGSKAIVVIPSYRAFGVSGDDNKIPPLTTVVYNIKVHRVL